MRWREKWGVDEIDSWEAPEIFKGAYPHGTTGLDREGSPIIFIPFAGIDVWGLLHCASKREIIKNTIKLLEGESSHFSPVRIVKLTIIRSSQRLHENRIRTKQNLWTGSTQIHRDLRHGKLLDETICIPASRRVSHQHFSDVLE